MASPADMRKVSPGDLAKKNLDPAQVKADFEAAMATPAHSLEEEAELYARAHAILHEALS